MKKINFICPYCFERCRVADVQFRCTNRRCKQYPDPEMTAYEHGDPTMPKQLNKTFSAGKSSLPKFGICPDCGSKTYKYVCPKCHNELPQSTLEGRDMIISIVGSRATGKSHYVGVTIYEIMRRVASGFGGSLEGFADSYQRWQEHFEKRLYVDKVKLDKTESSIVNVNNGAYRPLIFKLKLKHKRPIGESIESFTFVFFDTAGEDLNDEDTMSTVNKYICKSAGIIFLLDPTQIPVVASKLDEQTFEGASGKGGKKAAGAKADDIMTRVSNLIRNDNGLSERAKIDIPVAAVFSKFDVVAPLIPQDCVVLRPSPHCGEGRFDLTDHHNVGEEIKALLHEWNEDSFISQLDTNYKTYSFFGASALGLNNNPRSDGRIDTPRPHRIEDPVLWLLYRNGVIKGK